MSFSAWHDSNGNLFWGIMGGVDEVPANYSTSTIIYYADGINKVVLHGYYFRCTRSHRENS
jgi:hypothetical protein